MKDPIQLGNEEAFPSESEFEWKLSKGLTKREYFASQYNPTKYIQPLTIQQHAQKAVEWADALCRELAK